ncbi:MAG: putative rane protein [Verrucomicrobia bacterium]|nr:putative rane protein [Verrucomicrobiota bacterium]
MPEWIDRLLGLHVSASDLTSLQMAARTAVVFLFGVALVRLADRRFLGRNAGFDVLLGVVLGSVLSRGINGQASFFPTLGASALLIVLHRILGAAACHSEAVSRLLKGRARTLVNDGRVDHAELTRCRLSAEDLDENLRVNGNVSRTQDVAEARLERNGQVSVVKKKSLARE